MLINFKRALLLALPRRPLGHKNAGIPHNNLAVDYVYGKRNETGEADENVNNRGESRAWDRRMFADEMMAARLVFKDS